MPCQQSLGSPVPNIADHGEVLHQAAIGKQRLLLLANANDYIAQRLSIGIAGFFGNIIHFAAVFDNHTVFAVRLPSRRAASDSCARSLRTRCAPAALLPAVHPVTTRLSSVRGRPSRHESSAL